MHYWINHRIELFIYIGCFRLVDIEMPFILNIIPISQTRKKYALFFARSVVRSQAKFTVYVCLCRFIYDSGNMNIH